jgi:hypothetical protein
VRSLIPSRKQIIEQFRGHRHTGPRMMTPTSQERSREAADKNNSVGFLARGKYSSGKARVTTGLAPIDFKTKEQDAHGRK